MPAVFVYSGIDQTLGISEGGNQLYVVFVYSGTDQAIAWVYEYCGVWCSPPWLPLYASCASYDSYATYATYASYASYASYATYATYATHASYANQAKLSKPCVYTCVLITHHNLAMMWLLIKAL